MYDIVGSIVVVVALILLILFICFVVRKDELIEEKQKELISTFNDDEKIKFSEYVKVGKSVKFKDVLTYGRKKKVK